MSDVTLLRTLTRKSKIKFGTYPNATVGDMLVMPDGPYKLVGMYCDLSAINFADDILDELMILPEERIAKPGRMTKEGSKEFRYRIKGRHIAAAKERAGSEERYMGEAMRRKKNIRINGYAQCGSTRGLQRMAKGRGARYNQGHR